MLLALGAAVLTAIPLGVLMGLNPLAGAALDPLVEFYRPIPPLAYLPLIVIWFGIGELSKVLLIYLALFAPLLIATAAGVRRVDRSRVQAVRCLGASRWQVVRYVILPSAFKRVLPPLAGQFISLVKDTSLVSVIAITELTKSGREAITTSFSTFEIWFCVAALYLLLNLPLSHMASRLERRLGQSD